MKTICTNHEMQQGLGSSRPSINRGKGIMRKSKSIMFTAAAAVASILGAAAAPSYATPTTAITLQNKNSAITVDPDNSDEMYNWTVDGTNELSQQWFWYRTGSTGSQTSISNLTVQGTPTILDTNGSGENNWAQVTYADAAKSFTLTTTYLLTGGQTGSKASDISETIDITNTSQAVLDYHFFESSDFNLSGTENVSLSGLNSAQQNTGTQYSETIVSPRASEYEAAPAATLASDLNSTPDLTLNNATSLTSASPAWGFEWDAVLNPGCSLVIGIDKQITPSVPEPTSAVALIGMGGIFFSRPRGRDKDLDTRTAQVAEA